MKQSKTLDILFCLAGFGIVVYEIIHISELLETFTLFGLIVFLVPSIMGVLLVMVGLKGFLAGK